MQNLDSIRHDKVPATRRKVVECALCETGLTKNNNGICRSCLYSWKVGEAYLDQRDEIEQGEEIVKAAVPTRVVIGHSVAETRDQLSDLLPDKPVAFDSDVDSSIWAIILSFVQTVKSNGTNHNPESFGWHSDVAFKTDRGWASKIRYLSASRSQLEAVHNLLRLLRYYARINYEEGYKRGSNMLCRLAEGEMTVADLNENEISMK